MLCPLCRHAESFRDKYGHTQIGNIFLVFTLMFALLSRPIARRSVGYAARCMSQIPPVPPKPPQTDAQEQPQPTSTSFPSLDILPTEEQEEPRRTGARSRDSVTSAEAQRKQVGRISAALLAVLFGFNVAYMSRDWSEDELKDKRLVRY